MRAYSQGLRNSQGRYHLIKIIITIKQLNKKSWSRGNKGPEALNSRHKVAIVNGLGTITVEKH